MLRRTVLLLLIACIIAVALLALRNAPCANLHKVQTITRLLKNPTPQTNLAASLSLAIYRAFPKDGACPRTLTLVGNSEFKPLRARGETCLTEGAVGNIGETTWIVFAGSHSRQNWMTNAMATLTPLDGCCKVHSGALLAFLAVKGQLKKALTEVAKDAKIVVTGHSLGAMLAQLAAYHLATSGYTNLTNLTFATPPVGDKDFTELYNKNVHSARHFVVFGDPLHHLDVWRSRRSLYADVKGITYLDPGTSLLTACPSVPTGQ